uniref:Activator of Hsp90 ATPase AHSA1-like N-terminal domain-containing protein n=1 Tax=Oreochromis niloticus TaxID=8128 RepID=A0A669DXW6_ORENI
MSCRGVKFRGTIDVSNLSDENDEDDLDICMALCKDQPNTPLLDLMKTSGVQEVRRVLGEYVRRLKSVEVAWPAPDVDVACVDMAWLAPDANVAWPAPGVNVAEKVVPDPVVLMVAMVTGQAPRTLQLQRCDAGQAPWTSQLQRRDAPYGLKNTYLTSLFGTLQCNVAKHPFLTSVDIIHGYAHDMSAHFYWKCLLVKLSARNLHLHC